MLGFFKRAAEIVAPSAIEWPTRCGDVFASAASDDRGVMIAFWAAPIPGGPDLLLVDYDRSHDFEGAAAYVEYLATQEVLVKTRAINGAVSDQKHPAAEAHDFGSPPPRIILPRALRHFALPYFEVFPDLRASRVTEHREQLLHTAAVALAMRKVRTSSRAHSRARSVPNPLSEIKVGAPESAPQLCAMLALFGLHDVPQEFRT